MNAGELVTLKTRVSRQAADELAELARRRDRSIAAELRLAIASHVAAAAGESRRVERAAALSPQEAPGYDA